MKKLVLLFIINALISCGINKKQKLEYDLPSKTINLTQEDFTSKKDLQSGRIGSTFKEFYQTDDVLVALSETRNGNFEITMLVNHEKILSNLINDPSIKPNDFQNYTSRIEKIGNNQVLIQNYDYSEGKKYYEFEIVNSNFTKQKLGIIQYYQDDEKKATSILNNLLKKFQF